MLRMPNPAKQPLICFPYPELETDEDLRVQLMPDDAGCFYNSLVLVSICFKVDLKTSSSTYRVRRHSVKHLNRPVTSRREECQGVVGKDMSKSHL